MTQLFKSSPQQRRAGGSGSWGHGRGGRWLW